MLRSWTAGTRRSRHAWAHARLRYQRLPRTNRPLIQRPARNWARRRFRNTGTRRRRHRRHRGFRTGRQFGRQIRTRRHNRPYCRLSRQRTALLRRHRRSRGSGSFRPPLLCRRTRCGGAGRWPAFRRRGWERLPRAGKNLSWFRWCGGSRNRTCRRARAWNRRTAGSDHCRRRHRAARGGWRCRRRRRRRRRCRRYGRRSGRTRSFWNRANRRAADRRVNRSPRQRRTNRRGMPGCQRRFRSLLRLHRRLCFRTHRRGTLRGLRFHRGNAGPFGRRGLGFRLLHFGDGDRALRLRLFVSAAAGARARLR